MIGKISGVVQQIDRRLPFPKNYTSHIVIASIISIWLVLFLIFIAPFDVRELTFINRLILLPTYGIITFISYMVVSVAENNLYARKMKWTIGYEIVFLLLFNALSLSGCYLYYQSNIMNGLYSFGEFTLGIYYPTFLLLLILLVTLRWLYFQRDSKQSSTEQIIIKGANKLDILQTSTSNIIAVSSSDNYVIIHHIVNGELQKKLLRTTLKKVEAQHAFLRRIHRSHLINPNHFVEWNDAHSINMTLLGSIPVSKTYKSVLFDDNVFTP